MQKLINWLDKFAPNLAEQLAEWYANANGLYYCPNCGDFTYDAFLGRCQLCKSR